MDKWLFSIFFLLSFLVSSCGQKKDEHTLKVAATSVPQAEMLRYIAPDLKAQGIDLNIIVMDDYNQLNRALADGEVNANFFQHIPYLEQQKKQFHYNLCILCKVHIEPMGMYSSKYHSLLDIPAGSLITIPNDPTNEGRALLFLQSKGLITLDSSNLDHLTLRNIQYNSKQFKFLEVDAAMLPRTLPDVSAAIIPTNYALQAQLSPLKNAIAIESNDSPYVNVIVVRCGTENDPSLIALKDAMTSDKMKQYILTQYKGAVVPAF